MALQVAGCPPLLWTKMLVLVVIWWLTGGAQALSMQQKADQTEGPLWNATKLDLSSKGLSGLIPRELGGLSNLTYIDLDDNSLFGPILPELGNLTRLDHLVLSNNNLSGPIPRDLGNLTSLEYLSAWGNNLSGPIPFELGNLTRLTNLYLNNNNLSGSIPPGLGNFEALVALDLSKNGLSGPIPTQLGNVTNVTYVGIFRNYLSGPIPPELGKLTSILHLYLANNSLSGPIPPEIGNLPRLAPDLDLHNNNLSGVIPPGFLAKFGREVFDGNPGLCFNDSDATCSAPPPLAPLSPPPPTFTPPNSPPLFNPPPALPFVPPPQAASPKPAQPPFESPPSDPPQSQPPVPLPAPSPSSSASVGPIVGGLVAGAVVVLFLSLGLYCFIWRRRRMADSATGLEKGEKDVAMEGEVFQQPAPKQTSQTQPAPKAPAPKLLEQGHFTLKQLQRATGNFDKANLIGRGSFGLVYKGTLSNGLVVAVKRLESRPGRKHFEDRAWKAEVDALRKVRHKNLVTLFGVCVERGERLLVFEYFVRGSLDKRLHHAGQGEPVLSWAERVGIARSICLGLTYLHNGLRPPMVHRDSKAANILLFDDDVPDACITDFGLAHLVQDAGGKTSTMVKGTVPYMAPEYLHGGTQFLSPKCDVYSFGVLLLELISGRPVVRQLESGMVERLSEVVVDLVREGKVLKLVDPKLGGDFDAEEARNFIHVAMACLRKNPVGRPIMESVASRLALAPAEDMAFDEMDIERGSEGSGEFLPGNMSSSSSARSNMQSTVLVASRFVTPR